MTRMVPELVSLRNSTLSFKKLLDSSCEQGEGGAFQVPVLWGLSYLTLGCSSLGGALPAGGCLPVRGQSYR